VAAEVEKGEQKPLIRRLRRFPQIKKQMRDERTYKVIGCGMEVHKELGCGFLEAVYQEALERELAAQKVPFKSQQALEISYKGKPLNKSYQPDFICFGKIIVEIKAISSLSGTEEAQLLNYLKASGLNVGLLINFGAKSLEYKRIVLNL
jgi:GxxExxY protein